MKTFELSFTSNGGKPYRCVVRAPDIIEAWAEVGAKFDELYDGDGYHGEQLANDGAPEDDWVATRMQNLGDQADASDEVVAMLLVTADCLILPSFSDKALATMATAVDNDFVRTAAEGGSRVVESDPTLPPAIISDDELDDRRQERRRAMLAGFMCATLNLRRGSRRGNRPQPGVYSWSRGELVLVEDESRA